MRDFKTRSSQLNLASQWPERGVKVTKLSELLGEEWASIKNNWGEPTSIDFALTEPFQLLSSESASRLREIASEYYGGDCEYSTARTSACLRGASRLEAAIASIGPELERIVSHFTGLPMKMAWRMDYAHLNVQRTVQSKPVDNWHQDSTAFVLVTILTDHAEDSGGTLMVRKRGISDETHCCKLMHPGDSIFMQGSQIYHKAEQSAIGERLTLVTSFYCDLPEVYDSSSIRASVEYSPPRRIVREFQQHTLGRFKKSAALLENAVLSAATVSDFCRVKAIAAAILQELVKLRDASRTLPRHMNPKVPKKFVHDAVIGLELLGSLHDSVLGDTSHNEALSSPLELARRVASLVTQKKMVYTNVAAARL